MRNFRIIPRLDIKNGLLIKGINLEGLRVLGEPLDFANRYFLDGADEICYIDIVASLYGTENIPKYIKKTAKRIFIPLCVGGGIKNLFDIELFLKSGADKVCLNSILFKNINFLNTAAKKFGTSTITVIIEITKIKKKLYITSNNGRELHFINPFEWIKKLQDNGAGEFIITSVLDEGLKKGFNPKILEKLSNIIKIPYLLHGGFGSKEQIYEVAKNSTASGVLISSLFHYNYMHCSYLNLKKVKIGNTYFAKNFKSGKRKNFFYEIKNYLKEKKINVRL